MRVFQWSHRCIWRANYCRSSQGRASVEECEESGGQAGQGDRVPDIGERYGAECVFDARRIDELLAGSFAFDGECF